MKPPAGLRDVVSVDTGGDVAMAALADGTVVTWGNGIETTYQKVNAASVAVDEYRGERRMAVTKDGEVVNLGLEWRQENSYDEGPPPGLDQVKSLHIDYGYGVAVKEDGSVVGGGAALRGGRKVFPQTERLKDITSTAAIYNFLIGLDKNGAVHSAYRSDTYIPDAVQTGVRQIAGGQERFVALKHDGTVVEWQPSSHDGRYYEKSFRAPGAVSVTGQGLAVREDGTVFNYRGESRMNPPKDLVGKVSSVASADTRQEIRAGKQAEAARVSATAGDGQKAAPGARFDTVLKALAADASGKPVGGHKLRFSIEGGTGSKFLAGGGVPADSFDWDTRGDGSLEAWPLQAGDRPGKFTVTVASTTNPQAKAEYQLEVTAPAVGKLEAAAGDGQSAESGDAFTTPLAVKALTEDGKPVEAPVRFDISGDTGSTFLVDGKPATTTEATTSDGVATAPALTAGPHTGKAVPSVTPPSS